MNITNLQSGLVINNYKELCKLLEIIPKTSDSKIAQLKEMDRYFSYRKEGIKFHIEEIYPEPLPEDNNITKYGEALEKLLLHFMVNSMDSDNRVYIRKNELMVLLGMMNEKYAEYKYRQLSLKKELKVSKEAILDFYKSSSRMLKRNLENALNSLQSQSLLLWGNVFTVDCVQVVPNSEVLVQSEKLDKIGNKIYSYSRDLKVYHKHREATASESDFILGLQKKLLRDLGLKEMYEIYENGQSEMFYKKVKKELLELKEIANYYESFSLTFNKKQALLEYEILDNLILNDELKQQMNEMLNTVIVENNTALAKSRHEKAKGSTDKPKLMKKRSTKKYVSDSIKINKELIQREF